MRVLRAPTVDDEAVPMHAIAMDVMESGPAEDAVHKRARVDLSSYHQLRDEMKAKYNLSPPSASTTSSPAASAALGSSPVAPPAASP